MLKSTGQATKVRVEMWIQELSLSETLTDREILLNPAGFLTDIINTAQMLLKYIGVTFWASDWLVDWL